MLEISKSKIAQLENPFWTRFWGQRRLCKPYFCPTVLGNGDFLLAITPMATRPHYYTIRVDSRWDTSNYEEDGLCVADHLDEIYDALEDYFGPVEYEGNSGRQCVAPWPAFEFGCGQCWSDAMDLLGLPMITKVGWVGTRKPLANSCAL